MKQKPITIKQAEEMKPGTRVRGTCEYFLSEEGRIQSRNNVDFTGRFVKWAPWSGMGTHFVAEVAVKYEGTKFVPRVYLFLEDEDE